MDENLHKDNLEEFFKNSFNDENVDPSGDQWDVPSDAVWTNIDETINPVVPPAASVFTLKSMLAVAAGILILGLVYYNYTLQNRVAELIEVVENQKVTIEKLEGMVLENETKNVESNDAEREIESNFSKNEPEVENGNIETFSSADFATVSKQKSTFKNTPSQNNFEKDKSVGNSQITKSDAGKPGTKKDAALVDLKNEQASAEADILVADQNSSEILASNSKQKPQENAGSKSSVFLQNDFSVLTPLSSKMIFAEANSQADEITLDILPISEEIFTPSISSTSRTGFYAGAHIAPTYGYRNIKSVDGPVLRRLLNEKEKAVYSVSLGMKAGYQFSKNWSVETGLNYYKNTIQSLHRAQVRYESQIERLNSDGNYDSNYQLKLATSYGEIETDIALTRSSDAQISQNEYINLVLRTQQELKNLGIPIAIRYRTAKNKLHFSAKAGFSTNFILQKDVTVKAAAVTRNGIKHRRTIVDRQFVGLKNTTIDFLFGIGLDYDLSKNMSIYFEPTMTRSINPVYQINEKIKTYPILAAFNIGLNYHF